MRGKTIQIFLTDGTPRGIKLAEITSNIEQAIFIPRKQINEALERKEVSKPGVYFLFGNGIDSAKPIAYIGQSRNCIERIKTHDQKKEFWNYAVLIISKTNSFTKTHIEYLEQLAIIKGKEVNRYDLNNEVVPQKIHVTETLESDLLDNFDTIKILLSTLGFTIFEPLNKGIKGKNIFYCKGKKANAKGHYEEDGFVVHKGSKAILDLSSKSNNTVRNLRVKLLDAGILSQENEVLIFNEDYSFNSPSSASSQVLGRNSNGWKEWKNSEGKTLDEKLRN